MYEWIAFGILALVAMALGSVWAQRRLSPELAAAFQLGLFLRFVGSTARVEVIERVYSGFGDAKAYYDYGRMYADQIRSLDLTFLVDGDPMTGQWWGTQFVRVVTGFVMFMTGDSYRAGFLAFSLFSFTGLVLCVRAFSSALGPKHELYYARAVWLWPSLWFWPSSIGKEALMLLAVGMTVWGYVGLGGRVRWLVVAAGLALASSIRPHIASAIGCCVLIAESVRQGSLVGPRRIAGLIVAGAIAVYSVSAGLEQLGLGEADLEGVQEQFEFRGGKTEHGGSRIDVASGWSAIPMAFITILMRPFPWEARGIVLLSAAEISILWLLILLRWREAWAFLRGWRSNSFTRFALPFALGISLMYGLAFGNLGIIARQRAVILPFLLTLLSAGWFGAAARARTSVPALAEGKLH